MATTPLTTLFRCTATTVSKHVPNFMSSVFVYYECLLGEYHVLGAIWFQTPEQSVRSLLHDPPGSHRLNLARTWLRVNIVQDILDGIFHTRLATLGIFFVIYYLLCCWTYGNHSPF